MIIDFNQLPTEVLEHFKDGEKKLVRQFYNGPKMIVMHGDLEPGASIGMHKHEVNSEVLYVIKGQGKVLFQGEYLPINEGMCHYCPKGESHSLINSGNEHLVFVAVVPEQ